MAVDTTVYDWTCGSVEDKVAVNPHLLPLWGATLYIPPTPEVHVANTPTPMYIRPWVPSKAAYTLQTTGGMVVYVGSDMPKQTSALIPGTHYWPDGSGRSGLVGDVDLLYAVRRGLDYWTGHTWTLTISASGYVTVTCSNNQVLDFTSLDSDFPAETLGFVSGTSYTLTAGVPYTSPNPSSLVWAPNRPWQRDTGDLAKPVGASVQTVGGASRGYVVSRTAMRTITHNGLSLASVTGSWGLSDQLGYWRDAPVRIYPDQADSSDYSTYTLVSGDPTLSSTLLPRYDVELRFMSYTQPFTSDYAYDPSTTTGDVRTDTDPVWVGSGFTFSFWVHSLAATDAVILRLGGNDSDRCVQITKDDDTLVVGIADTASSVVTWTSAVSSIQVGVWTHFIVSYDGSWSGGTTALKVFRNGADVTAAGTFGTWTTAPATVRTPTDGTLYLGAHAPTSVGAFDGYIDDVGYWARSICRTEDSAESLYASGVPVDLRRALPQQPTHYWRFERDLGDTMGASDMILVNVGGYDTQFARRT